MLLSRHSHILILFNLSLKTNTNHAIGILQSLWFSFALWDSRLVDSLGTSPSPSLHGQRSGERRRWFIVGLLSMRMAMRRWKRFRLGRRQRRRLRDVRGARGRRTDFRIWLQGSIVDTLCIMMYYISLKFVQGLEKLLYFQLVCFKIDNRYLYNSCCWRVRLRS